MEKEPQHPCDHCGSMTDESELQVPPDAVEGDVEFWCAECIHACEYDPEEEGN